MLGFYYKNINHCCQKGFRNLEKVCKLWCNLVPCHVTLRCSLHNQNRTKLLEWSSILSAKYNWNDVTTLCVATPAVVSSMICTEMDIK